MAYAVDAYHEPVSETVNDGLHSVIVAGVWSYGDSIIDFPVTIDSLAVYNPWNQAWGRYLDGAYYYRVPYSEWSGSDGKDYYWLHGYDWNGSKYVNSYDDPDPYMGIYQAGIDGYTGKGTSNPNAQHWVGYYISIERDAHSDYNANYTYNENDVPMGGP